MKTYKFLAIIGFVLIGTQVQIQAQQFPLHYMYDQYKYTVNPAAIKIGEGVGINANYSNHWNDNLFDNKHIGFGIDGGFFQNNMGLGLVFSQEIQGILRTSNVQLSYAYRVKLKTNHFLTFGISAGVSYQGQKTENIITGDYSDPLIGESYTGFLTGFGINYQWKGLEIDAVIPSYNTINKEHFPLFLSLGYDFKLNKEWHLKPALMYSLLSPGANMLDIRLKFAYKEWIWLQLGYRTTNELLVLLGGSYKNVSLGIGGGFNLSGYGDVNKGNLEVILAYRFKNAVTKKSKSQFETETKESISQLSDDVSTLITNDERQKRELNEIKSSIETLNREIKEEYKESVSEIKETILSIKKEDLEVDESKILDRQYFVVVFSTKTPESAERIVNRMAKQNEKGFVLKDSNRSYYYIYTSNHTDLDAALEASKKERERGFSGAWVLVVK
jgi:type IX secretion system PorP/SprF family membrane protein